MLFPDSVTLCVSSGHRSCCFPHYATLHEFDLTALPGLFLHFTLILYTSTSIQNEKPCGDNVDFFFFIFFNGLIKAYTSWLADCHRLVSAMTVYRLCGRDHCLHWKDAGLNYRKKEQRKPKMKKTKNRKCVMTWLYLDSSIKPAGCRRCILGSSTLVFVWEGVPACGGDFFFLFLPITDVYKWIFLLFYAYYKKILYLYSVCVRVWET